MQTGSETSALPRRPAVPAPPGRARAPDPPGARIRYIVTIGDGLTGSVRMHIELFDLSSRAGGGSLPLLELPSKCVGVKLTGISVNTVQRFMRETAASYFTEKGCPVDTKYDFILADWSDWPKNIILLLLLLLQRKMRSPLHHLILKMTNDT